MQTLAQAVRTLAAAFTPCIPTFLGGSREPILKPLLASTGPGTTSELQKCSPSKAGGRRGQEGWLPGRAERARCGC